MSSPTAVSDLESHPSLNISEFSEGEVSPKESILALFESAARQTVAPELAHRIRQVIETKRRGLLAS